MATGRHSLSPAAWVCLGIYRYVPLLLYGLLRIGYSLFPFLRPILGERLGLSLLPGGPGPLVWFHGSSVGEVSSIGPVVAEIKDRLPDARILVTTMTVTGRRRAEKELRGVDAKVIPLDFLPSIRGFVGALKPAILIVGETEIWPNLVVETRRTGASLVLVNGRISRKSYPRYRLVRPLVEYLLGHFDLLLMRSEIDARRIRDLGGRDDQVRVVGNTKFDILPKPLPGESRTRVRQQLGIDPSRLVISLGSARSGESEIVLEAVYAGLGDLEPVVVIAPRHMSLVPQIEEICRLRGLTSATVGGQGSETAAAGNPQVLIIDQMGHLLEVYAVSDIAIVGGTFKPLGGHNPLEPASQGTVTVVGPHIHNIADDIKYLRSQGAACVVEEMELAGLLDRLGRDRTGRQKMAERAVHAVKHRKGIAAECVRIMADEGLLP